MSASRTKRGMKFADDRSMSTGDDPRNANPAFTPRDKAGKLSPNAAAHFAPSPEGTYASVERLGGIIGRLGQLLDGSMLAITNASQCLARHASSLDEAASAEMHLALTNACEKLEQIAELVHGAMQGRSLALGSPLLSKSRPVTLRDAIEHAAMVLAPTFERHEIEVRIQVPDGVASTPAGALYTVILNALANAGESISRRRGPGCITVCVRREPAPRMGGYGRDSREWQTLEIIDDGEGPPATRDSNRVFDLGFTTKARGTGVGLAVAKSVIQSMGGTIELFANLEKTPLGKRGAVLRARYPAPDALLQMRFGGAA